jgi:hypothetical protein
MSTSASFLFKTCLAACALALAGAAHAIEVGGVKLDDSVKVAGKELKLNGAGLRVRAIFKVYALGLYLGKKETSAEAVIAAPGPRRFTIVMLREVTSDEFGQAFMSGINANTDKAEKGKIVNQMVKFGEIFANQAALKKGDTLTGDWIPDKGTVIELNGKPVSEPIPDVAFYNALLKIWVGDKPADKDLKPLLLGAKPETVAVNTGSN